MFHAWIRLRISSRRNIIMAAGLRECVIRSHEFSSSSQKKNSRASSRALYASFSGWPMPWKSARLLHISFSRYIFRLGLHICTPSFQVFSQSTFKGQDRISSHRNGRCSLFISNLFVGHRWLGDVFMRIFVFQCVFSVRFFISQRSTSFFWLGCNILFAPARKCDLGRIGLCPLLNYLHFKFFNVRLLFFAITILTWFFNIQLFSSTI